MPISKPRSSLRLYVLIRVAAVSEPPLDHSGVTVFRRAYYSIWHEVVHSVGDRYSDYLRSAARSGVPPWVAAAKPTLARQRKRYRSRSGQNVFREQISGINDTRLPEYPRDANYTQTASGMYRY